MSDSALEVVDLSYSYTSNWLHRRLPTVENVSLSIAPGESFGFLGHNGAGKTTTIKCILGLIRPHDGKISIFGEDRRSLEARRRVGYLPEQPYFYDHLTVRELVEMYACLAGVPRSSRASYIAEALDKVRISARSKSPMRSLSKGLTQRVAMAQAIVGRPQLLILDEPFSGLDPIGRKEFRELLSALREERTAIFMSSHILSDVEYLCDRASILSQGRLRGIFSLNELPSLGNARYDLTLAGVDLPPALARDALISKAAQGRTTYQFAEKSRAEEALAQALSGGLTVLSYTTSQGDLEDLFMRLVTFSEAGEEPQVDAVRESKMEIMQEEKCSNTFAQ